MKLYNQTINEEMRNFCNCPQKYQLIDFVGAAMGAFFVYQNAVFLQAKYNRLNVIGLVIGSIMLYIHTARFFYAEQVKSGAREIQ